MTTELADTIIGLKPDPEVMARVEALGQKANEGTLTDEEGVEYSALIDAGDLIAVLKAKARGYLNRTGG